MEERADQLSARDAAESGTNARALEKIHRSWLLPVVMAGRTKSHPDLYDRMVADGVEPDYPRPPPPARSRIWIACIVSYGVAMAVLFAANTLFLAIGSSLVTKPSAAVSVTLFGGGTIDNIAELGDESARARHFDRVLWYRNAASRLHPERCDLRAEYALALAEALCCKKAERVSARLPARDSPDDGEDNDCYLNVDRQSIFVAIDGCKMAGIESPMNDHCPD